MKKKILTCNLSTSHKMQRCYIVVKHIFSIIIAIRYVVTLFYMQKDHLKNPIHLKDNIYIKLKRSVTLYKMSKCYIVVKHTF